MPYARSGGFNIYYEVEGNGPPIMIHHGLASSLESMREFGFSGALNNEYQVILMDGRGHGKSDKPHDPAMYTPECTVDDVVAVLDELGIETTNFFGYSYGGSVGFECARLAPRRTRAVIAGGAGATHSPPEVMEENIRRFRAGMEGMVTMFERAGLVSPVLKKMIMDNDVEALVAVCQAIITMPSIIGDVPKMNIPFLLFCGDKDPAYVRAKQTAALLPDVTFITLPGLDHGQAGSRPDLVIPQIKEFLARVNQK